MRPLRLLGMPVDRLEAGAFAARFVAAAQGGQRGYACVPNAHVCLMARDDQAYAEIVRNADFIMPDSTVLHRLVEAKYGLPRLDVMRGDALTLAICREAARRGIAVALFGGKSDAVLERVVAHLREECPGLEIAFACSPPFRPLSDEERETMLTDAAASGARIGFVGLGAPKQERWMADNSDALPMMLIGVGAAFDYIAGEVETSADWVHAAGFEWLHRLLSEPRRLWRRYLVAGPRFLALVTREIALERLRRNRAPSGPDADQ